MKPKPISTSQPPLSPPDAHEAYKEKVKLYKIIKGSERVKKARKMMNLNEGEYIVQFMIYKGWDETKVRNKSGKLEERKLLHYTKRDWEYYANVVEAYVRVKIINYFQLKLPLNFIMDAIFKKPFVPKSFVYSERINKQTGYHQVTIEFLEVLNPANKTLLMEKLEESMFFLEECYRTKNTQGLNTRLPSFQQIKSIPVDQQYEIYQKYQELKSKSEKIPREEMQKLVETAKKLLGKKAGTGFNRKALQDMVYDFEKYFYN